MFPIDFPLGVLRQVREGLVVDPFCGRGTTNLAAWIRGLNTIGVDSSRVAVAATAAKLTKTLIKADAVAALAAEAISSTVCASVPRGEFWDFAYHPEVLRQLCAIRAFLNAGCRTDTAKALRAVVLGSLHGPKRKEGSSSYLSNQAPRTYAPKPRYSVKFWRQHKHHPPLVNIIDVIRQRADRAFAASIGLVRSRVRCADSRRIDWSSLTAGLEPISCIVTSPPYYGLRTYRPDQWLREWFLGGDPEVNYSNAGQVRHVSPEAFAEDLRTIWHALAGQAAPRARVVIRFGAINDRPVKADDLIRESLARSGWRVRRLSPAGVATLGRRQATSFTERVGPAVQEVDVWCSLR
jgi:hypothetical protein